MKTTRPDWAGVLPVGPMLRHFCLNFWHLRSVLLVLLAFLGAANSLLLRCEGPNLAQAAGSRSQLTELFFVTLTALLPVRVSTFEPATTVGRLVLGAEGFCGFVLLGIVLWVVQESMAGQRLKASRYLIFPTKTDL